MSQASFEVSNPPTTAITTRAFLRATQREVVFAGRSERLSLLPFGNVINTGPCSFLINIFHLLLSLPETLRGKGKVNVKSGVEST